MIRAVNPSFALGEAKFESLTLWPRSAARLRVEASHETAPITCFRLFYFHGSGCTPIRHHRSHGKTSNETIEEKVSA